jgi:hypothetical protein
MRDIAATDIKIRISARKSDTSLKKLTRREGLQFLKNNNHTE